MKKLVLSALAISVVTIGVWAGTAYAQTDPTPTDPGPQTPDITEVEREEIRAEQQQAREDRQVERVLARCEAIKTRLTAHIGRVNDGTERHVGVYERLNGRLDLVITRADEVGYDSTDLVTARNSIGEKIELFSQTAADATAQLSSAADAACEDDIAPYGTAISGSRDNLRATRAAALEIRTTFRELAIPALQEFAAWLEVNQSTEQE